MNDASQHESHKTPDAAGAHPADAHPAGAHNDPAHPHIDPLGAYWTVFGLLLALLLLTVYVYHFDMGVLNTVVAIIIACVKTSLVMLVFMHLRHGTKLTWVIASTGFIWLCIMITFTFADYLSRESIPEAVKKPLPAVVATTETPHTDAPVSTP